MDRVEMKRREIERYDNLIEKIEELSDDREFMKAVELVNNRLNKAFEGVITEGEVDIIDDLVMDYIKDIRNSNLAERLYFVLKYDAKTDKAVFVVSKDKDGEDMFYSCDMDIVGERDSDNINRYPSACIENTRVRLITDYCVLETMWDYLNNNVVGNYKVVEYRATEELVNRIGYLPFS